MKKIITITKWEVLQRVKNRLFVITLIVTPLLVLGIGAATGLLSESSLNYTKVIGIRGAEKQLLQILSQNYETELLKDGQPSFIAVNLPKEINVDFSLVDLVIDINKRNNTFQIDAIPNLSISPLELEKVKRIAEKSIFEYSLLESEAEINPPKVYFIESSHNTQNLNAENYIEFFFTSFAFLFLLIVVVIFSGSNFVRALLEEKTTHIIEILLSSASPKDIIIGKFFGLIIIGLIQTIFWFTLSYLFFSKGTVNLDWGNNFPIILLNFILGYLLYTSIYLAFGAQVSSETESQQITTLISLFLILPIVLSTQILIAPNSLFSSVLTYFPLTTAPIMLIKVNITQISLSEFLITTFIQLAAISIVFVVSSKYFSEGLTQFSRKKRKKI